MLILLRATRAKGRVWVGLIGELQPGPNFIQAGAAQARDDKLGHISGVDLQPGVCGLPVVARPGIFWAAPGSCSLSSGGQARLSPTKSASRYFSQACTWRQPQNRCRGLIPLILAQNLPIPPESPFPSDLRAGDRTLPRLKPPVKVARYIPGSGQTPEPGNPSPSSQTTRETTFWTLANF